MSTFKLSHGIAVSIFVSVLSACHPTPQQDPRTQIPLVQVSSIQTSEQPERAFTGVVTARVQSDLGFRVGGKIIERIVTTGQLVKKGDVLMRIDPTDLALASLAQSGAAEAARARAFQTAADEKRYGDLVSAGAVSASTYDQMKAAAESARAQLNTAEARANMARNEATYAVLLADADGVVVETLSEPGQVVAAGQTVVRLAHAGPREAVIDLPEAIRPTVGSAARAVLFNGTTDSNAATLRQLSASASPLTRTFEARYVLNGSAASAALGSTVTIRIPDPSAHDVVQIPLSAIHDQGQGPGVWVVRGEEPQVAWRRVELAGLAEETAAVSSGLNNGELYVAVGAHLLHEGDRVRTTYLGATK